jgi:hypothetical protein
MFATVKHHGIRILLPAAVLALLLPEGKTHAQARLQTRQNVQCQRTGGQGQPNSQQQLNALRNAMQNTMRQLNASQQTAQLTSAQLQAVNDLQSALQNALQQLNALQNGSSTLSQLQILSQQQAGSAPPPRAAPMFGGR